MDPSIIDQRFHLESPTIKDKHLQPGHVVYAPYPGIQPQIESYYWGRITKKFRLVGVRAYRYSIEFVDGDELTCIGSDPMHRLREALRLMERGQIHENWPPRAYEEIQQDLEEDEGSSSSYSGAGCMDEEDDDFLPNETHLQKELDSDDLMDDEEEDKEGCQSREASLQERTPIQSEIDDLIGDEDDEEDDGLLREAGLQQYHPSALSHDKIALGNNSSEDEAVVRISTPIKKRKAMICRDKSAREKGKIPEIVSPESVTKRDVKIIDRRACLKKFFPFHQPIARRRIPISIRRGLAKGSSDFSLRREDFGIQQLNLHVVRKKAPAKKVSADNLLSLEADGLLVPVRKIKQKGKCRNKRTIEPSCRMILSGSEKAILDTDKGYWKWI